MPYSVHLLRRTRLIIGQNIHKRREQRKITLEKLSALSGVEPWRIDHYELGKSNIPLQDLLRIACALKIDIRELLT